MPFRNIRTGREFGDEMNDSAKKFQRYVEQQLPDQVVEVAQKLVDDSFEKEQYQDGKSGGWQDRKNDDQAGSARTQRRALLVKDGKLIGSTNAEKKGKDIVIAINDPQAAEYGQVHNEGGNSGKGRGFKMPKRQFMPAPGETNPKLEKDIDDLMDKALDLIFK